MKKLLLLLTIAFSLALTACQKEYDYSDFEKEQINSHLQAETKNEDFYFVYYYSDDCVYCNDVKQDILTFFDSLNGVSYYMLNVDEATDESAFSQYRGTPTVLVVAGNEVVSTYESKLGIEDFIFEYSDFDVADYLSYSMFDHIYSFDDVETQEEGTYYVYFYHPDCGYCKLIEKQVLNYANEEPDGLKVYLLNGQDLPNYANPYSITGTPSIIYVEDNEFVVKGSGTTSVLDMLNIHMSDYDEFDHLSSFSEVETQAEGTYLVYYYSVSCGYCNQIKEEVLDFAESNDANMKVYFINAAEVPSQGSYNITGTPSLLYIVDNEFEDKISGAYDVPEFLQNLE